MAEMHQYLREIELHPDRDVSVSRFPLSLPVISNLGRLRFHPRCTFLVGENGSGKSTILEALAIHLGIAAEGGSRNFRFTTYDSHSDLHEFLRVAKGIRRPRDMFFLRAESFYNVATEVKRLGLDGPGGPYGGDLHGKSHGESFRALFDERLFGGGVYLVDEPEAALSPNRQLSLLTRIHDLIRNESQFVIATHSPIIMAYPDAWIYHLTDSGPERVAYEDTEHFAVTRLFLTRREKMLDELLSDDEMSE